jgi:hypothetical protein
MGRSNGICIGWWHSKITVNLWHFPFSSCCQNLLWFLPTCCPIQQPKKYRSTELIWMWVRVTRLWARNPGQISCKFRRLSHLQNIQTGSGTNPTSHSVVPRVLCLMEKWLKHKISDHSPTSEATIKNWCKAVPPCTCHRHEKKKSLPLSLSAVFT